MNNKVVICPGCGKESTNPTDDKWHSITDAVNGYTFDRKGKMIKFAKADGEAV